MAPKVQRQAAKKQVEVVSESPKEEMMEVPMMEKTPEPVTVPLEQVKAPDAPKKRGRKPKNSDDGEADAPKVRKPRTKKVMNEEKVSDDEKVTDDDKEDKPKKVRKPRTKKTTDDEKEEKPKKERKPRAKTEYNIFIGEKMKELREKHKDDTEKLKTTEYMKMAIAEWKLHKEAKANA